MELRELMFLRKASGEVIPDDPTNIFKFDSVKNHEGVTVRGTEFYGTALSLKSFTLKTKQYIRPSQTFKISFYAYNEGDSGSSSTGLTLKLYPIASDQIELAALPLNQHTETYYEKTIQMPQKSADSMNFSCNKSLNDVVWHFKDMRIVIIEE